MQRDGQPNLYSIIKPKGERHLDKHRSAVDQVRSFLSKIAYDKDGVLLPIVHAVEERLGGFTGGMTSKQTLMALAAVNAVVSHELSQTGEVIHIPPVTTKRITGLIVHKETGETKKEAVIKLARASDEHFPYAEKPSGDWATGTDDMADAWLLAEACRKIVLGEASLGTKKKAKRDKAKAGGAARGRQKKV